MHSTKLPLQFRLLGTLLLILLVKRVSGCPDYVNSRIERCVQPVVEYAKVLNQHENATAPAGNNARSHFGKALQFPKLGGQVFKELCRLIRAFDLCVQPYKQVCPKHITINLIDASYGYLCNEGYETFMASAECLMALDQKPQVKHCHDQTLTDIENANSEATLRMDSKLTRMCSALNYFAACVRQHIWQNCGVDAWQVIFRVLKDTTKTLMPSCVFSSESAKLDAEQRQQQADEDDAESREIENLNRIVNNNHGTRSRSTSSTQLAIQSVYSDESKSQDQNSRSLEAQQDEGMLDQPPPNNGQLNERPPISFEIHEEPVDNQLDERQPMTARFGGTWSSSTSTRSHFLQLFASLFLVYRIFEF
ncbi:hypothetical protein M3Y97_00918600 [Aphelenchoides bicaudatus]|nr:hypothetical protein M3Y97_00918600 [Aphelenchoides bicaudatus]